MRSYTDQSISEFHQVWTCDGLLFGSRYLIYPFETLAYLRSESKERIFPHSMLLLSGFCSCHLSNIILIMLLGDFHFTPMCLLP